MELLAVVGFVVVIAVICALFELPEKFQKLLYILCAVLVIGVVIAFFVSLFGGPGFHFITRN